MRVCMCVYVTTVPACVLYMRARSHCSRYHRERDASRCAREMRTKYRFDTVTFLLAVSHFSSSFCTGLLCYYY